MRKLKRIAVCLLAAMCMVCMCVPVTAEAKAKVAKVDKTMKYKGDKERFTLFGVTGSGKKVWRYKCGWNLATELNSVSYKVSGDSVYVIDGRTFVRLSLQKGKALAKKKNFFPEEDAPYSAAMYIDKKGYLYATGYYGDRIYKISPKGKLVWEKTVRSDCAWPTEIKASGNKMTIYYEGAGSPDVVINMKTGKIIKYI